MIRSDNFAGLDAAGTQRFRRPNGARHFMIQCYPTAAATTPSAYPHVVCRGLTGLQAAGITGGPGTDHWRVEHDFLEHPTLYSQWIPLPDDVEAVAVIAGTDAGCVGAVLRGSILWNLGD